MSLKTLGYKEAFVQCWTEGYMSASIAIHGGEYPENPYDFLEEHYEHEAWECGWSWYLSMVH